MTYFKRLFCVNGLKELFDTIEAVKIFSFWKEIGLDMYNKIKFSGGIFTIFDFICITQLAGRDFILHY